MKRTFCNIYLVSSEYFKTFVIIFVHVCNKLTRSIHCNIMCLVKINFIVIFLNVITINCVDFLSKM